MICPQTPTGSRKRVVEHLPGNRNSFAFDLRGPTGEVFKVFRDLRQINVGRLLDRFAVIRSFQRRQFRAVLFNQLRQFVEHAPAIARADLRPLAFKRSARRGHGFIDVFFVGFGYFGERFAGRRIRRSECLAGFGIDPLSVDQKLIFTRGVCLRLVVLMTL